MTKFEIDILDIEGIISCDCGIVLEICKFMKQQEGHNDILIGKCPLCKKELTYYGNDD